MSLSFLRSTVSCLLALLKIEAKPSPADGAVPARRRAGYGISEGMRHRLGSWLAFLALALLATSLTATAGLAIHKSSAATSKLVNILAISGQDIPPSLILDNRSKSGWSRTSERGQAVQSTDRDGISPATAQLIEGQPYPAFATLAQGAVKLASLRYFDAQAPPSRQ